jgi:hypothetical protein
VRKTADFQGFFSGFSGDLREAKQHEKFSLT